MNLRVFHGFSKISGKQLQAMCDHDFYDNTFVVNKTFPSRCTRLPLFIYEEVYFNILNDVIGQYCARNKLYIEQKHEIKFIYYLNQVQTCFVFLIINLLPGRTFVKSLNKIIILYQISTSSTNVF